MIEVAIDCEPGRQNQLPGAAPPDPCCKLAQIRRGEFGPPPTAGEAGQLVSILHIMIITNRLLIIIFFGKFIRSRLPTPTLRSVLSGVLVDDINDRATDGHGEVLRNHGKMKEVQRTTQMTVGSLHQLWADLCILYQSRIS